MSWDSQPPDKDLLDKPNVSWDAEPPDADLVEQISELESGARGLGQGLSMGLSDEAVGGVEALWEKAKGNPEEFGKLYALSRDESRANNLKAKEANPGSYMTGEIGGGVASAFVPGMNIAKGASLGRIAAQSALQGGLMGFGNSEAEGMDLAKDTALGSTIGGVGGAALAKGAQLASPLIQKGMQSSGEGAGRMAKRFGARALGAERATVKKLGPEGIEELGDYALKNKLLTPLGSTDDILARNEAVMNNAMDQRSAAYQAIDDAGASAFNPLAAAEQVEGKVVGNLNRSFDDTQELVQALDPHLSNILSRGQDNLSMKEAQALVQSLGKKAKFDTSRSNTANDVAVDAYFALREALNEAADKGAETVGISGLRETIENSNKLYSTGTKAKGLLDNKFAREQGNKLLGLTDTITGTEALSALGGPKTAALLAVKKGAERYGSQNAALGLDKFSQAMMKSPQMEKFFHVNPAAFTSLSNRLQQSVPKAKPKIAEESKAPDREALLQKTQGSKYGQVLQNAAQKSDQSFAAAHYVLNSRDEGYRKLLEGEENDLDQALFPTA